MKIRIDRINELKNRMDLTTNEMADIAECSIDSYYKYQNENAPQPWKMECLCNVADYFKCDLDYLLDRQNCETKALTDIKKATGLSEDAIKEITNRPEYNDYVLNYEKDLPLDYDSLSWCITHGLIDIIEEMRNVRSYGAVIKPLNISKELYDVIKNSFSDATTSDTIFQMNSIRCFSHSLIKSLLKYKNEKLGQFKDALSSCYKEHNTGIYHKITDDDKEIVNQEIESINTISYKHALDPDLVDLIRKITLYSLMLCYPPLYFNYTLETSKFAISKHFNNLVDDYMNEFISKKGDEK